MTTSLHKSYLGKVPTKGLEVGGQKYLEICPRGLWMTPLTKTGDMVFYAIMYMTNFFRKQVFETNWTDRHYTEISVIRFYYQVAFCSGHFICSCMYFDIFKNHRGHP